MTLIVDDYQNNRLIRKGNQFGPAFVLYAKCLHLVQYPSDSYRRRHLRFRLKAAGKGGGLMADKICHPPVYIDGIPFRGKPLKIAPVDLKCDCCAAVYSVDDTGF